MTDAHSTVEHFTFIYNYPSHEPRESDVHYAAFHAAHERLKRLGALKCWIDNDDCDKEHPIELHHSTVEFALANIVDVDHFRALYPEFHLMNDEEFLLWVESEGNLLPLCKAHHTGLLGVHTIHYPAWITQRFLRTGVPVPEMKTT